jgi:hypothetical protein
MPSQVLFIMRRKKCECKILTKLLFLPEFKSIEIRFMLDNILANEVKITLSLEENMRLECSKSVRVLTYRLTRTHYSDSDPTSVRP